MKGRRPLFLLSLVFLIGLVGNAAVQVLPSATDSDGAFGLPDQRGSRILVLTSQYDRDHVLTNAVPTLARPELLKTALCTADRRATVQFERRQAESPNDERQTWRNFDKLAGNVYTVLGNTIDSNATCFLASETLLAGSTVLNIAAPDGPGACRTPDRFATLRDRPVVHCWPIARMTAEKQIVLIEFERRGKDALASFVVVDGSRTIFADIHGEYRGPGEDLWGVDDGGVLQPERLEIVCAVQRRNWFALGTAWNGAESGTLSLWTSDGSEQFTRVINDNWYQPPL